MNARKCLYLLLSLVLSQSAANAQVTVEKERGGYTVRASEKFDLRYEEIDGSPALVQKMIAGPWDAEFVVVPPGETITYEMFAR